MEKFFDVHAHYTQFLRDVSIAEQVDIYQKEMELTGTYKISFLSCAHHADGGVCLTFDPLQNIRGLYLKHAFAPVGYAFAALEHTKMDADKATRSADYLAQAKEYHAAGFDGIKMLEGYPSIRKVMGVPLYDEVYDEFYSYLEENRIPIILHIANPPEFWDMSKVSDWVKKAGRACDETYPTKDGLQKEVDEVMKKHPKLRLALAHFGFMSYDINQAKAWLDDYENTMFDLTPGGEQLINMGKNWDEWHDFFVQYQDRIVYGSDLRAFPFTTQEEWETAVMRRPGLVRKFFETNEKHLYEAAETTEFYGVALEKEIREKIYYKNAERELGKPRAIDYAYMKKKAQDLLATNPTVDSYAKADLEYILQQLEK